MIRLLQIMVLILATGFVQAQDQPVKDICADIERFNNDSASTVELHSPGMWNNKLMPVVFTKTISPSGISYNLYLSTHSDMNLRDGKGVVVIFTDSTIWQKPGKINAYQVDKSYEYNTVIDLKPADVDLFSAKKIAKYMLFIFNQEVNDPEADSFRTAVNCVKNSE